jgi:hypothetical protein
MDPDADFAGARLRIGYVFVPQNFRRTIFMDDDGLHPCAFLLIVF